jgi:hypothetical protein
MPRRPIDLAANPLLDIASYARRGPGRRDHLLPAEIELIARTVNRTPLCVAPHKGAYVE